MKRFPFVSQLANKNQFVIEYNNYTVFQSYNSIMAVYDKEKNSIVIDNDETNFTKTTSKHLYMFFEMFGINIHSKKDLSKAIKAGEIETANLN